MTKTHFFPRRSYLDLLRANVWRIETGVVRATTCSDDGSLITLGFWGAGDIVGDRLFKQANYQLECLSAVTASPLLAQSCSQGEVSTIENRAMCSYVEQLQELLIIRSCKRIEDKLLKLLIWLSNQFGTPEKAGVSISIMLTHQDLAEALSTTRVTMTRCMRDLERQGVIRHVGKRRLVINTAATSMEPTSQQLFEKITLPSRHSSIAISNYSQLITQKSIGDLYGCRL